MSTNGNEVNKPSIKKIFMDRNSNKNVIRIDNDSVLGRFGWECFDESIIPYIFRLGKKYCLVQIVGKVLNKFLDKMHSDVYTHVSIQAHYITFTESKLLNEINVVHSDKQYGQDEYTKKDVIVLLSDVEKLYSYLSTCYSKLVNGVHHSKNNCGFIRIDKKSVIAYAVKDNEKYVPVLYFENIENEEYLKKKIVEFRDWEFCYLQFCFIIQGLRQEFYNRDSCSVIRINDITSYFPAGTNFEDYWPDNPLGSNLIVQNEKNTEFSEWTIAPKEELKLDTNKISLPLIGVQNATGFKPDLKSVTLAGQNKINITKLNKVNHVDVNNLQILASHNEKNTPCPTPHFKICSRNPNKDNNLQKKLPVSTASKNNTNVLGSAPHTERIIPIPTSQINQQLRNVSVPVTGQNVPILYTPRSAIGSTNLGQVNNIYPRNLVGTTPGRNRVNIYYLPQPTPMNQSNLEPSLPGAMVVHNRINISQPSGTTTVTSVPQHIANNPSPIVTISPVTASTTQPHPAPPLTVLSNVTTSDSRNIIHHNQESSTGSYANKIPINVNKGSNYINNNQNLMDKEKRLIQVPTLTQGTQNPYKIQVVIIEDKPISGVNLEPYKFDSSMLLCSLYEINEKCFNTIPLQFFKKILKLLHIKLYQANDLQIQLFMNCGICLSTNAEYVLIKTNDVFNSMTQIRYMGIGGSGGPPNKIMKTSNMSNINSKENI